MISQVISTHRNQTPCVFFRFFPRNVAGTPNRIPDLHQIEECQHLSRFHDTVDGSEILQPWDV